VQYAVNVGTGAKKIGITTEPLEIWSFSFSLVLTLGISMQTEDSESVVMPKHHISIRASNPPEQP
jgi:hypothetical protein